MCVRKFIQALVWLACLFGAQQLQAQNQLIVTPTLLPPYSPYFSDYLVYENKTTIIVTSATGAQYRFFLRGTITGDNGITITTKGAYKPSVPLVMTSPTLLLKGADLEEYFNWENVNVLGIDLPQLAKGDGLPEGNYTICLRAFDYDTGIPLSTDAPAGCVTINIKSIEPPIINLPQCGAIVKPNPAQVMVFSWNPPPGAPPTTRYLIKMAEMPMGVTNYNHALNTLTSPAFFEKDLPITTYTYTLADAPLTVGKTYAFKVVAYDPQNKLNFRNNGESEVCYFVYGDTESPEVKTTGNEATVTKRNLQSLAIATTKIKGRLVWAFHQDYEKDDNTIDNTVYVGRKEKFELANFASYAGAKDPTLTAAYAAAAQGKLSKPEEGNTGLSGQVSKVSDMVMSQSSTVAVVLTKQQRSVLAIESMAGKKRFPYANTTVRIYLGLPNTNFSYPANAGANPSSNTSSKNPVFTNISSVFSGNTVSNANGLSQAGIAVSKTDKYGRILLGIATTDEDGNFSIDAIDRDLWKNKGDVHVSLEFDHPNFLFATREIVVKPTKDGEINLGEHLGLAKTYKLHVKVQTKETSETDKGTALNEATIKILRKESYYSAHPHLQKEGNAFFKTPATDSGYVVVASGKAGTNFSRLFYNSNKRYQDEYLIKVEMKDYSFFTKSIIRIDSFENDNPQAGNNVTYLQNQIVEIVKLEAPTFIRGVLVTKDGDVPIVKTKIELITGSGNAEKIERTVTTDSAGNFSFDKVQPNAGVTYKLKINDPALGVVYPLLKDGNTSDPQQIVLANYGDSKLFRPLRISGNLVTVTGIVKNEEKAIVPGASLKWKQGGNTFKSNNEGNFTTAIVPGKHILVVTNPGYRQTEISIDVVGNTTKNTPGNNTTQFSSNAWANAVSGVTYNNVAKTTVQQGKSEANTKSVQMASSYGYTSASAMLADLVGDKDYLLSPTVLNVGDVIIKRFYVKVTVKDAVSNAAIGTAQVSDKNVEKIHVTDAAGSVIISDASGTAPTIIVQGPAGSLYVAKEVTFDLTAEKDTAIVNVSLEKGIAVTGQVLLSGAGVKQASVFVEGMAFIKTETDNSGNYTLAVKTGEYTLLAAKQGLQGDKKTVNVTGAITQNFNLSDPGFDASKLLGFEVEIYESKPGANANEKIISGAFIKIPGNPLFNLPANFKLPFSNQKINIAGGKPVADSITTTTSELPFNLFDYLPLKLKNTAGIKVKKVGTDGNTGAIVGSALLDLNGLLNKVMGLKLPADVEIALSGTGADKKEVTAFISNGALPLDGNNLKLLGLNNNSGEWEMFGTKLKIDFGKSFVFKDGIQLAGNIRFADFPVIGNKTFLINKFKVNTGGDVQFDVACDLNEQIDFSVWKLRLGNIQVNNFGVTASGAVDLSIPETDKVSVAFNNLSFSKSGISGGSFNIYSEAIASALKQFETAIAQAQDAYNKLIANAAATPGQIEQASNTLNQAKANFQNKLDQLLSTSNNEISIVKIIAYQPGKVPFSLNKIPGGNHYKLQGSGTFGLTQYIKDRIKLNYFAVSTDGNFAFNAPVNFKQDFLGLAEFEVTEFGLNTIKKSLTVGGKLFLKIPGFGIGAGAVITYYQGGKAELSGISFKMDVGPVGTFEGGLTIKERGFSGMGKLKIAGAFGIGGSFLYEKQDRGFRFGVSFEITPAPFIPVGIVAIGVNGGGFEINTNPGKESVMIAVRGSLKLVADPADATLAINPLEVKITVGAGGPILDGKGTITAATLSIGQGGFVIDIPNKYFTAFIDVGKSINLIPSAPLQAEAGARISASFAGGNEYFMVAMYNHINILNLFKSKTDILFAWGLRKNQGTIEDKYTAFIPDNYLHNGKIFGFGFSSFSEFGIPRERAIKFEIPLIVSASGYYFNRSGAEFYGNFKSGTYGFAIDSRFEAGAELKIVKVITIGGGMNVGGRIAGGYGGGNWFFDATLQAGIYGYANCETDCRNEICTWAFVPVGFTVCVNGSISMHLSNQRGFQSSIRLN